jgi:hypothetical protein
MTYDITPSTIQPPTLGLAPRYLMIFDACIFYGRYDDEDNSKWLVVFGMLYSYMKVNLLDIRPLAVYICLLYLKRVNRS